jgi:hypothetical protein
MPRHNGHDDNGKEPPDSYTRLNIRINEADNGIRPLPEELVTEDTVGYRSPDISFSQYPIPAGEPTLVRVVVWNRGTMDSTSTLLEVAYNLWIGNEAEANEPIADSRGGVDTTGHGVDARVRPRAGLRHLLAIELPRSVDELELVDQPPSREPQCQACADRG